MTKDHKIGIVVDGIVFELPKAVMCPEHTLCDECILNQSYCYDQAKGKPPVCLRIVAALEKRGVKP